jgi:hypothetical protein
MARITFLDILIFWLLLLGTLRGAISKLFFYVFGPFDLSVSAYMQILDGILYGNNSISPLSTFGSRGIVERF